MQHPALLLQITVEVGLPEKKLEELLESLNESYVSGGLSGGPAAAAAGSWRMLLAGQRTGRYRVICI